MKNELKLLGESIVNGKEIKTIEGGFGEGQKCITVQDIALQHEVETKDINRLINRNKEKFTNDELLDLLEDEGSKVTASHLNLITGRAQKYCYILSQRGYIKLVSMMANDNSKKWEVMNYLINDYFNMKTIIKQAQDSYLIEDPIKRAERWIEEQKEKQRIEEENKILAPKAEYTDRVLQAEGLIIKVHLSTWFKRMCEYGFEENIDFSILKSGNPNGGIAKIDDYIILFLHNLLLE